MTAILPAIATALAMVRLTADARCTTASAPAPPLRLVGAGRTACADGGGCSHGRATQNTRHATCAHQLPATPIAQRVKLSQQTAPRPLLDRTPARPIGRPPQDDLAADPSFPTPLPGSYDACTDESDLSSSEDSDSEDGAGHDEDDCGSAELAGIRDKCRDQHNSDLQATAVARAKQRSVEAEKKPTPAQKRRRRQQRRRNLRRKQTAQAAVRSGAATTGSGRSEGEGSTAQASATGLDEGQTPAARRSRPSVRTDAEEVEGWSTLDDQGPYTLLATSVFKELLTTKMRCAAFLDLNAPRHSRSVAWDHGWLRRASSAGDTSVMLCWSLATSLSHQVITGACVVLPTTATGSRSTSAAARCPLQCEICS